MLSKIQSKDYDGRICTLVHNTTLAPMLYGEAVITERNTYTVLGGKAPHKRGSTGRVFVHVEGAGDTEFFPAVVGAQWVPLGPETLTEKLTTILGAAP